MHTVLITHSAQSSTFPQPGHSLERNVFTPLSEPRIEKHGPLFLQDVVLPAEPQAIHHYKVSSRCKALHLEGWLDKTHPDQEEVAKAVDENDFLEFSDISGSVKVEKFLYNQPLILKETNVTSWTFGLTAGKVVLLEELSTKKQGPLSAGGSNPVIAFCHLADLVVVALLVLCSESTFGFALLIASVG
ncbi:hypothetical protein C8J56DRAFT_883263 [Mycena floridula]|nr:hypothetical protein C8J56DRAFT_883263 [Mycena floridula]